MFSVVCRTDCSFVSARMSQTVVLRSLSLSALSRSSLSLFRSVSLPLSASVLYPLHLLSTSSRTGLRRPAVRQRRGSAAASES